MKKATIWFCCGLLALATGLSTLKAKGQTDDDKTSLAIAAQPNVNEIKLSELGVFKATHPAVKQLKTLLDTRNAFAPGFRRGQVAADRGRR